MTSIAGTGVLRVQIKEYTTRYPASTTRKSSGSSDEHPTMSAPPLTPSQANALFSYLTHAQTLHEFHNFKYPGKIASSGKPFIPPDPPQKPSPILNFLLRTFVLSLPGWNKTGDEVYNVHIQTVLEKLAEENLSESYDKGNIGKRMTAGSFVAIISEFAIRGVLGGLPPRDIGDSKKKLDPTNSKQILEGWHDFYQRLVYLGEMDKMIDWLAHTPKVSEWPTHMQAVHQFCVLSVASFFHYMFVLNPSGQIIKNMAKGVHSMLPYALMRTGLAVGNAATMINMLKNIFLFRPPGLGRTPNLLDVISSTVLKSNISRMKKQIKALEKQPNTFTHEQIAALEQYVNNTSREAQESAREESIASNKSIVAVILGRAFVPVPGTPAAHDALMQRLSLLLSLRDHQKLVTVLCDSDFSPKHIEKGLRTVIAAFDPIIRSAHRGVDLGSALYDLKHWFDDMFALPDDASPLDYVRCMEKHAPDLDNFIHLISHNCPDVRIAYTEWSREALKNYRRKDPEGPDRGGAGDMTAELNELVDELPASLRQDIIKELDAYATSLAAITAHSRDRMAKLQDGPEEKAAEVGAGIGVWVPFWQWVVDDTLITPATVSGPVRHGGDTSVKRASANSDGEDRSARKGSASVAVGLGAGMPRMARTESLLRPKFEDLMIRKLLS